MNPMQRREFLKMAAVGSAGFVVSQNIFAGELAALADGAKFQIAADAKAAGKPLVHFWSVCVGAGRANEGLRAGWLEQLKLAHEQCGFQYVRFHGLFHSDMFVYHRANNQPVFNWQYIDDLFDRMLEIGVRPFVEFGFNPIDPLGGATPSVATPVGNVSTNAPATFPRGQQRRGQFWWQGNATPPSDLNRWAELIEHFARHCIGRYGIEEVRRWYFEVWNEPNLQPFFRGSTQQQYFALYNATALAVKKVDSKLRVGGPATSNFEVVLPAGKSRATVNREPTSADVEALNWRPVWVEDFLVYCHSNNLPLDFISTHPYPQDFPLDDLLTGLTVRMKRGIDATRNDLRLLRKIVDGSPYPQAEIHLTEWSSSPSSRDFTHDSLQAAAFVVKTNLESAGLVDSLSYWTFTDVFEEKGAGDTIFHGGFGIVNYQGIVKPTFHAYRFLNALGDEIISSADGVVVTRHRQTNKVTALAYHYPAEVKISLPGSSSIADAEKMLKRGMPEMFALKLEGLPPRARFLIETLDKTNGNAIAAWLAMGSPEPPTREQSAELRKAALATKREFVQADESGRLALRRTIEPWSLVLIAEQ